MELFGIEYLHSQYFWTTLAFLLLLGVISRFVLPAVNAALDARAASIKSDLDRATEQREEAERVLSEYQAQLAEARKEASQVVTQARAEAEALASRRLAEVEAEISRKGDEARKSIEAARMQALRDVQSEVTGLVVQVAEKLLDQSVDAKMAAKLTDEALKRGLNS